MRTIYNLSIATIICFYSHLPCLASENNNDEQPTTSSQNPKLHGSQGSKYKSKGKERVEDEDCKHSFHPQSFETDDLIDKSPEELNDLVIKMKIIKDIKESLAAIMLNNLQVEEKDRTVKQNKLMGEMKITQVEQAARLDEEFKEQERRTHLLRLQTQLLSENAKQHAEIERINIENDRAKLQLIEENRKAASTIWARASKSIWQGSDTGMDPVRQAAKRESNFRELQRQLEEKTERALGIESLKSEEDLMFSLD